LPNSEDILHPVKISLCLFDDLEKPVVSDLKVRQQEVAIKHLLLYDVENQEEFKHLERDYGNQHYQKAIVIGIKQNKRE
jgi:hypothetical protein